MADTGGGIAAPGAPGREGEELPGWTRPLVVVAHPDDESFGLGAVLATFVAGGARPSVLCFTHGEASTLHGVDGDLRTVRAAELERAARLLDLDEVTLLDEPDGRLDVAGRDRLAAAVVERARALGADGLLVFDSDGVTGHPDHVAATRAAVDAAARLGVPVLGWTLPAAVSHRLNEEFGASFGGREAPDTDFVITVDRRRQLDAVRAHPSQAVPGSVLWRRLELLGTKEYLRWLVRPSGRRADTTD